MSIFNCNNPPLPVSSEPTIPVILRGKKRQHNRSQLQQPRNVSPIRQPQLVHKQPPRVQPNQFIPRQQIPIVNFRSISAPRRAPTHSPIPPSPPVHFVLKPKPLQPVSSHQNNNKTHHHEGNQIRRCLDENLDRVYSEIRQRRLSPYFSNAKNLHNIEASKLKIQKNLVYDYIQLIYKDYGIPDPLEQNYRKSSFIHRKSNQLMREDLGFEEQLRTQTNRREVGNRRRNESIMTGSTNKKAVQLKQSFLIQMFSPAEKGITDYSNQKIHTSYDYENSRSRKKESTNINSSVSNPFISSGQLQQITEVNQRQKQIKQVYRFCFICEEPILQTNIDVHQRQRCQQFFHLYQMSLDEIRNTLIKKIIRLKGQSEQLYQFVFENETNIKDKLDSLKKQARKYLGSIDTNIKIDKQGKEKNVFNNICSRGVTKNFNQLMKSYEENYFKIYQNFRRLQWFILMLKNLQQQYYKQDSNSNERQTRQSVSPIIIRSHQNTNQSSSFQNRRFSLAK